MTSAASPASASDEQLDGILGKVLSGSPANGARVVARAWVDSAFRERVLADANPALAAAKFGVASAHR